jgi:hypothetical protein
MNRPFVRSVQLKDELMMSLSLPRLFPAVLGGFLIGSSLIGHAQDSDTPGIIRISDAKPPGAVVKNVGHGQVVHKGEYHAIDGATPNGAFPAGGPDCYGGDCPPGDCYGHGCYGHCHGHCHLKGLFREHYCTHSPDHGFSVPEKSPIYRRGVQYNRYYPNSWYGAPGTNISPGVVYPMIYQPTDTTQLGFYYQHVPFWMPNPNALPPRPIPSEWHVKAPASAPVAFHYPMSYRPGWGHGWGHGHGRRGRGAIDCPPGGGWVDGAPMSPGMTPAIAPNGAPIESVPPATQPPSDYESVPPAESTPEAAPPPDTSAQGMRIRRVSRQR